jgi:ribonucleoside-diphosphate reductase alpha chain
LRFLSGHQLSLFTGLAAGAQYPAAPALAAALSDVLSALGDEPANSTEGYETRPPAGGILPEAGALGPGRASSSSFTMEDRGIFGVPEARKGGAIFHAADAMKEYLDMGDAPSCHTCGAIMVRNGSCYRCMSCGSTSGCS